LELGVVIPEPCAFKKRLLNSVLPQDQLQSKVDELIGSIEGEFKKELISLVKRLLNLDSAKRPGIEQIKDELEKNFGESLVKSVWYIEIYALIE